MHDIYMYICYIRTFATNIISAIKLAMAITFWADIERKCCLLVNNRTVLNERLKKGGDTWDM